MARWYYSSDGSTKEGPVDAATLRSLTARGTVTPRTLVWKKGMSGWVKAGEVGGLMSETTPMPALPAPEASTPAFAPQPTPMPRAAAQPSRRRAISWKLAAGGVLLLALVYVAVSVLGPLMERQSRERTRAMSDATAKSTQEWKAAADARADESNGDTAPVAPLADGKPKNPSKPSVPAKVATLRFKGLSLEMTPREVTEAAPKVNDDAVTPPGAVVGFWSTDPLTPPVSAIPDDATGLWYFGYSFAPKSQPPNRSEESAEKRRDRELAEALFGTIAPGVGQEGHWKRISWVVVSFDASHRSQLAAIKLRLHYGPRGPMAIAPNDLKPDELAKKLVDSYDIPNFTPTAGGSGWEHVNRAEGWRADFACIHWTQASADAGLSDELLRWDDREIAEFASEVETARSLGGLAALGGNSDPAVVAAAASKLDTAWVLSVRRVTKSKDVELD